MKTLHKRCAGLDVHQKTVVCCLRVVSACLRARRSSEGAARNSVGTWRSWASQQSRAHSAVSRCDTASLTR
jgi:hypothetical protein